MTFVKVPIRPQLFFFSEVEFLFSQFYHWKFLAKGFVVMSWTNREPMHYVKKKSPEEMFRRTVKYWVKIANEQKLLTNLGKWSFWSITHNYETFLESAGLSESEFMPAFVTFHRSVKDNICCNPSIWLFWHWLAKMKRNWALKCWPSKAVEPRWGSKNIDQQFAPGAITHAYKRVSV